MTIKLSSVFVMGDYSDAALKALEATVAEEKADAITTSD